MESSKPIVHIAAVGDLHCSNARALHAGLQRGLAPAPARAAYRVVELEVEPAENGSALAAAP